MQARLADDVAYGVGSAIDRVLGDDDDDDDAYDDGGAPGRPRPGAKASSQPSSPSSPKARVSSADALLRTAARAAAKVAVSVQGALATEFDPPPQAVEALVAEKYAVPVNKRKKKEALRSLEKEHNTELR